MNAAARLVIAFLGVVAVSTTAALCYLAVSRGDGKDIKELALFTLGAIAGVLAKVGVDAAQSLIPAPVHVTNTPSDPVPTDPQG